MRTALLAGLLLMTAAVPAGAASDASQTLTDFTPSGGDFGWYVVNDNVMGGRSDGGFRIDDGALRFTGDTNTNGGGFSSIRTAPLDIDLSAHQGIRLRLRGDGRRYTWRVTTDARWRGRLVSYWAEFETDDGEWSVVDLPFSRFVPRFRGARLDGPGVDAGRISGMGLMIYDGRDGPFALDLASVSAYGEARAFSLTDYQWQRRLLVLSAPDSDDADLRAQIEAAAASRDDFADRDMTLIVLLDDGGAVGRERSLGARDVTALRSRLDIEPGIFEWRLVGKDGTVKRAARETVAMNEIYALIDTMPMRRREQEQQRP